MPRRVVLMILVLVSLLSSCSKEAATPAVGEGGREVNTVPVIKDQQQAVISVALNPQPAYTDSIITAVVKATGVNKDPLSYLYAWKVNNKPIGVPKSDNQFHGQKIQKGDKIAVVVTPSDGKVPGRNVASGTIVISNSAPKITSLPPDTLENAVFTYHVIATDPDNDKLSYSLSGAPSGMTIERATGLIKWQPKPETVKGELKVTVTADDGDGGIVHQDFALMLEMQAVEK